MNSINPLINSILEALKLVFIAAGTLLVALHMQDTAAYAWVEKAAGLTMVAGAAAWGLFQAGFTLYKQIAAAVQAGINLTAEGKAVDNAGNVISQFSAAAATPPKPVTVSTATAIVKEFAPPPATIAKA